MVKLYFYNDKRYFTTIKPKHDKSIEWKLNSFFTTIKRKNKLYISLHKNVKTILKTDYLEVYNDKTISLKWCLNLEMVLIEVCQELCFK